MKKNESILNIVIPGGINQIYTLNANKIYLYEQLLKELTKNFLNNSEVDSNELIDINEIKPFMKNFEVPNNGQISLQLFLICKLLYNQNQTNETKEKINEFKNFFEIIPKNILDEVKTNYTIILLHNNFTNLLIDYIILSTFLNVDYSNYFDFKIEIEEEIKLNPKNYFIFHWDLNHLFHFNNLGTWTAYLTFYTFTNLFYLKEKNPFVKINEINLDIINEKGRFFQFSTNHFLTLRKYYYLLQEVNLSINLKAEKDLLENKLNKINPIFVILFTKLIFKKKELNKSLHYTSNEKVHFISDISTIENKEKDLPLSINGRFDVLLIKLVENGEVKSHYTIIDKANKLKEENKNILLINDFKFIKCFIERSSMISFLKEFVSLDSVNKINNNYKLKVKIPETFPSKLIDVLEIKQFEDFLTENKLHLPVILKFTGDTTDINHMLIIIITKEGINNFLNFIKSYTKDKANSIYFF